MSRCAEGEGRARPPGPRRSCAGVFAVMSLLATTTGAVASPPPAPAAPLREIAHLQRFLTLAARAHPQEPPVRVLFYGQSIIGQWYAAFRDHLKQRYPSRPWQFENRALDGHLAPYLLRTAEADVYRFQPDLLVFHAYDEGAPWASYAELLRRVRQRTCADILMVGNHLAVGDALDEASLTNTLPPELWPGTAAADYLYLPAIAAETGACRADIRTPWKAWLRAAGLEPSAVRSDFIHLNATGVEWVVRLLAPYVEPRLFVPPVDPFQCGRVRRVRLDGRTELAFTGNRLLLAAVGGPSRVACRVDGRPPSQWATLYQHGRASPWPRSVLPALLQVGALTRPQVEDWTLTVEALLGERQFTFRLRGSLTGEDGVGRTDEDFTSTSGRVVIRAADWYWAAYRGGLEPGYTVRWSTALWGADFAEADGPWRWIEVANGLEDGPHTLRLELRSGRLEDFPEVLIYHPAGAEAGGGPEPLLRVLGGLGTVLLSWPEATGHTLARSPDARTWLPLPGGTARFGRREWQGTAEGEAGFFRLWPAPGP